MEISSDRVTMKPVIGHPKTGVWLFGRWREPSGKKMISCPN